MRRYKPSNGTEGVMFDDAWCAKCQRDAAYRKTGKGSGCFIIVRAMIDEDPPSEWIIDEDGVKCTAFQKIKPRELRKKRVQKDHPNQLKLF